MIDYSKKSIGLIGLGYWGKNIFRNLKELGVLHSASDSDAKLLANWKEKEPAVQFEIDPKKIIQDKNIRAVFIAVPSTQHFPLAKLALLAGKDVFVEKPMTLTMEEGEELVALAAKEKRILMVGHILQYHPAVVKLKELVSSGELGKVEYIYSNRLNIGIMRMDENIWWSFAPHDVSVILSILGEEPAEIHAFGGDFIRKGVFDTTLVDLQFPGGVKAHIFVSWLHPFKEQKLVVVGSRGMAVFDDGSEEKLLIYPHKIEWREGKIPYAHKAEYHAIPLPKGEPLKLEVEHFLNCVQKRIKPITDGDEGLRVTSVLVRAQKLLLQNGQEKKGLENPLIHSTAIIDSGAQIGKGTRIWHFSHVLKDTVIGEDCVLGQNVMAGPKVKIGNRVKIQNNVSVYEGVEIGDDVFCGPSMVFTNVINPRAFVERKSEFKKTIVDKGATLGANSTILCGTHIGSYALIGAGAVVTKDVPAHALMVGMPARQIGWVCQCGCTLKVRADKTNLICTSCGFILELNKMSSTKSQRSKPILKKLKPKKKSSKRK